MPIGGRVGAKIGGIDGGAVGLIVEASEREADVAQGAVEQVAELVEEAVVLAGVGGGSGRGRGRSAAVVTDEAEVRRGRRLAGRDVVRIRHLMVRIGTTHRPI